MGSGQQPRELPLDDTVFTVVGLVALEPPYSTGHLTMNIGIYQSYWGPVGGGQRYVAVVAEMLARTHQVEIVHHCPDFNPADIEEPLEVDLSAVRFHYVRPPVRPVWPTRNPWRRLTLESQFASDLSSPYDLYIDSSDSPPYFCHAPRGVLLVHFPLTTFDQFHGHANPAWRQRPAPLRCAMGAFHRIEWRRRMATYPLCLCNSRFTQGWLGKRWGIHAAEVVYPPLREGFRPEVEAKENLILAIGAFRGARHKKHQSLIESFRQLCDDGLSSWQLVLAGACGDDADDLAYVEHLRAAAEDYPIELQTDLSSDRLRSLLHRAACLWHAMGHGVDPLREPDRMEHFGMVATEAMAAGCVPIVFDGGGLPEIVTQGETGFRWTTLEELQQHTRLIAEDPTRRIAIARAAVADTERFATKAFETRLTQALGPMLVSRL